MPKKTKPKITVDYPEPPGLTPAQERELKKRLQSAVVLFFPEIEGCEIELRIKVNKG